MRRHPEMDGSQARRRIPDAAAQQLKLPFVPLSSTGQPFKLFIRHGALPGLAVVGRFNAHGLSQQGATVPWF